MAVLTGGTSDIPVAEEAAGTAEWMGCRVDRIYDVGVAWSTSTTASAQDFHAAMMLQRVAEAKT